MTNETRILIVDDSMVILELVRHLLEQEGYVAWTASGGEEALQVIQRRGLPHLAIVDINMPGMDGFGFCQKIHKFSDVPVIMLSAEEEESVVVASLKQHAEDYIIKPKSGPLRAEELKARVYAVLKRIGDFSYTLAPVVTVDQHLQIDFAGRRAIVAGRSKKLTPIETKLLHILMRHAGRILTSDYLIQRLWPLEEVYEDRLHTNIYRLRKKIEHNPGQPRYVMSEWGQGYTFPVPSAA